MQKASCSIPMRSQNEDEHSEGEQRFVSIGLDPVERLLVVVYTFRGEDIRLIFARRATRKERRAYEAGI